MAANLAKPKRSAWLGVANGAPRRKRSESGAGLGVCGDRISPVRCRENSGDWGAALNRIAIAALFLALTGCASVPSGAPTNSELLAHDDQAKAPFDYELF